MSYAVLEVREAQSTRRPFHAIIKDSVTIGERDTLYEAAVLMGALGLAARNATKYTVIDLDDRHRDVIATAEYHECYTRLWSDQGLRDIFDELGKLGYGRKEIASLLAQLRRDPILDTFEVSRETQWYDTGKDILEDN